jgi:hypothetical protein
MASIPRNYSDKFVTGKSDIDLMMNKNAEWVNFPFVKAIYVFIIALIWVILYSSQIFTASECWTVVNTVHGVVYDFYHSLY